MLKRLYAIKSAVIPNSVRPLLVVVFITATSLLYAQDNGDLICAKPQYRPRGDKHLNCKDISLRRQGLWKYYSYAGYLLQDINYKDNKMHGECTWYYASTGKIRIKSTYFDGKRDGEYVSYYFNGQTQTEGEYNYGKRTGTWTNYYNTTGETKSTGLYINGRQNGLWKYYLSNGKLQKTVEYNNGQQIKTTYPDPPPPKVPALASPGK